MKILRRIAPRVAAAVALLCSVLVVAVPSASALPSILGGGSGFAALEIDQWRADTARSPYNLSVNYVAQGSSFGRQQFSQGTFDYGASDIQYVQLELPDLRSRRCAGKALEQCFVYVPVSAGGLAFMYNLIDGAGRRVTDLKLTRRAACKIFTGAITTWNDPEIRATNPRLASVARDIHPVIRADGAGESYVFSEFCLAVAPDVWSAFVAQQRAQNSANAPPEFLAGQPTSIWPQENWGKNPVPIPFADGDANYVADPVGGKDAITYVAAGYAKVRSFPTASLQNAANQFVQPDEENVTVALGYATPRGNGTFRLQFGGPDPRAYFPSTYSYILAQTTGYDPQKGATLGQFLCYAVSQGQVIAPQLRYARLSSSLVNIAIDAIVKIPGAPGKNNCFLAGAPPPPPPPSVAGVGSAAGGGSSSGGSGSGNGTSRRGATSSTVPGQSTGTNGDATNDDALDDAAASEGLDESSPDAELARATAGAQPAEASTSVIWLLLAGVVAAWAVSAAISFRRRQA